MPIVEMVELDLDNEQVSRGRSLRLAGDAVQAPRFCLAELQCCYLLRLPTVALLFCNAGPSLFNRRLGFAL